MKALRSLRVLDSFERYFSANAATLHRCPVCRKQHEVTPARARFSYGRQLTCGPDCEAERRRRIRAAYRAMTLRAVRSARLPAAKEIPASIPIEPRRSEGALRLVGGTESRATFTVIVESAAVLQVRRAVFESAANAVEVVKAVPLPRSSKVRMWVSIQAGAADAIRSAIMRAVPAGEFGRVCRA